MEAIISIINYITIIKRKNVYTERVGKFKTAVEFPMMITALLATKVNGFYYVFIVLFILTLYFQIQSIMAYINQLNNKTKEVNVSFKDKKVYEKIILLLTSKMMNGFMRFRHLVLKFLNLLKICYLVLLSIR